MKRLLIGILLMASFKSYAGWFDNKHEVYVCEKYSCSDKRCFDTGKKNIQIEFIPNKSKNSIFAKWFRNGKVETNEVLKNCYIVNDKNWRCEETTEYTSFTSYMTNGKYEQTIMTTINHRTTQVSVCSK